MASFPGSLRAYVTHVNTTEVIDASHVNDLQNEVNAVQSFVGLNPHISSSSTGSSLGAWASGSRTYTSLADRVANVEAGHAADTHSQYVRFAGTETITGQKSFTSDVVIGSTTATSNGILYLSTGTTGGQAAVWWREGTVNRWAVYRNQGTNTLALYDALRPGDHAVFTAGASNTAAGTAFNSNLTVAGTTLLNGNLTASGTTALQTTTATTLTLTGALTLAAGTGVAATTSAVGDAAGGGTSTTAARADHVHGREVFGTGFTTASVAAGTPGGAPSVSRSDHNHSVSVGSPVVLNTYGLGAGDGASTALSRADHSHGTVPFPTPAQVGALALTGGTLTGGIVTGRIQPTNAGAAGTDYANAAIEIREGGGGTGTRVRPRVSFHMTGLIASQLAMDEDGAIVARDNPGTGYQAFRASQLYEGTTRVYSPNNPQVVAGSATAVVAQTSFGLAATAGTATTYSKGDHSHGSPTAPSASNLNVVSRAGDTMTGALYVGLINLQPAGGANTGYVEFRSAGNVRQGYIGFSSTTAANDAGTIPYVAGAHSFIGTLNTSGILSENGNRVYSTANPPPSAAPVVIMPFYVGGSIGTGLRRPEFIATVPMTLRGARSRSFAGSGTYSIYVNGASISGAASGFSTAQALYTFAAYNINAGDRVQLNVDTASVDAVDLSVTVDVVTR